MARVEAKRSGPGRIRAARSPAVESGAAAFGAVRFSAALFSAILFSVVALAGCTSASAPTPNSTSAQPSTSAPPTNSTSARSTSSTSARPVTSTSVRYDASTLIGSNIYDFPLGRPGPHGGVLLPQMVGTSPINVAGATAPVSMYIPCCTDSAHLMLVYRVGSTPPGELTQIPIADDQAIVLAGRLIAIHAIVPVGSQPRVQAQVIVFPVSAATGLPVVK